MRHALSMAALLLVAAFPVFAAELKPIQVEALIDGRSRLIIQGNSVWWYHMEWTAPGRHGDGGANWPTVINGEPWMPKWPDRQSPQNEFGFCESSKYEKLEPPLPKLPLKLTIEDAQARGEVHVIQQPAKPNDYTLIVEITDEAGGSDTYSFALVPAPGEEPQPIRASDGKTLRDGLVGEYLLNGTAGDSSGKGNDGTATDVTPTTDRFGRANSAMQFNGKTSFIDTAKPPAITEKEMSVSVWARYDRFPDADWNGCIVAQDNGQDHRTFQLAANGNHLVWHRMMEYGWDPVSLQKLEPAKWYHLVGTFDGKQHTLYIDGALQQSLPGSMIAYETEPMYIGRKGTDEKMFYFAGAIDDLRIYNRALKPEEVMALYEMKP